MALQNHKITPADISSKGIQAVPGSFLTGTVSENKARFDQLIADIVSVRLNGLIDELITELSGKMPQPAQDGVAGQYLKTDGAGHRSWDTPSGSGDMLKSRYDADNDGVVDAAESCTGNAATAAKWQTARCFTVSDADGSHSGAVQSVDGSADAVLPLPGTIRADVIGSVTGSVIGNVTGNVSGNVNGNAATASGLAEGAVLPVAKGGTGASDAAGARSNLGVPALKHAAQHESGGDDPVTPAGIGAMPIWRLLWTNASPTSSFAAQTISLDLSACSFVIILFRHSTGGATALMSNIINVGSTARLLTGSPENNRIGMRSARVETTGVVFSGCTFNNDTNNDVAVPCFIYGL